MQWREPGASADGLAAAIAERQAAFLQAQSRLLALETHPPRTPEPARPDRRLPEALLRRALQCLAGSAEYLLALRILETGSLSTDPDDVSTVSLQTLAQSGLAAWDPSTGQLRATSLLAELMRFFESGIDGVGGPPTR